MSVLLRVKEKTPVTMSATGNDPVKMKVSEAVHVGGASFEIDDETLIVEDRVLRVNTTGEVEPGNKQPVTSGAVSALVGLLDNLDTDSKENIIAAVNEIYGRSVKSIEQTVVSTEDGGVNEYTITLADGSETTLQIRNGGPGKPGQDGRPGQDGAAGFSPVVSVEEITGGHRVTITDAKGPETFDVLNGKDGKDGSNGKDGKTPEKGVDYFTEEDKREIAQMVEIDRIDAEKVYFSRDLETTFEIGTLKLSNGKATLKSNGKNLVEVWETIFLQEKNPSTTQPSVSLTFSQAGTYEVGTKLTPSYSATLKAGSYTYGPATGITASSWAVNDTPGNKKTTASGSFPELTVEDDTEYKVTAKATYGAGAIPVTNRGNPYSAGQIKAGSKSATSKAITGYRNTFYGTLEAKTAPTSGIIRDLPGKSEAALANDSAFSVDIPVGALRVVIAYPATLQDVTSIKDVNGMGAEISSGFTKQSVNVEGAGGHKAIAYKVYTMDFAEANDTANTFDVII